MLHKLILAVLLISVAFLPRIVIAQADKIYERVNPAVIVVLTYDAKNKPIAQGSGFFVRSDGAFVTNLHVVSNAVSIKVKISKEKQLDVEGVIYSDEKNDLVVLKAQGENLPTVSLGNSDAVKPGEKVYVIGSPAGLENTISDGIISGIRTFDKTKKVIQITAPISPGSSGGPVFNEAGEVIGVSSFVLVGAQNLNFAMPINLVKDKVNNKDITKINALGKSSIPDITNSSSHWLQQGIILFAGKKYKEAAEAFKKAVLIKGDSEECHYWLGLTYFRLKDYQNAIKSCKKAVELNKDYAVGHRALGWIYQASGSSNDAIYAFGAAIKLEPKDGEAYYGTGEVYLDKEDYPNAIGNFKKAVEYGVEEEILPDLYKSMGYAYEKNKNFENSINAFREAVKLRTDDAELVFLLGRAYLWARNYYSASESFKKVLKTQSLDSETCLLAHFTLGLTYIAMGSKENAKNEIKTIQDLKNLKGPNISGWQKNAVKTLNIVADNPQRVWEVIYELKIKRD